ncbi:cytochrome P450 81D1-like [Chenopodium quinoa]|uniref:Cytochrome P450 n=1 Tax=Chenopodium quinoa TaxID=63459 RepID=A0A803MTH4_CHEQI|nr:cytochrome P450 81D1-like [Chenopodium quinoa]
MDHNSILLYFAIFVVSYILAKTFLHKFKNYPPSPFPILPILGHLHLLKDQNSIHRTLSNLSQKLGPVITLQFGSRRGILVSSPSAAEDCLHHNDISFANRPRLVAGKILGYDYTTILWAPHGPLWRNHRKIAATEILSSHRLQLLANIRADEVRSLVKRLSQKGGDEVVVEIKEALFELTNNVMMRMIAGKKIYGEAVVSNEAKRFREVVKELMEIGAPSSVVDFFPFLKYLGIHISKEKKYKAIFMKFDKFFQDLVDEKRRKAHEQGVIDCGGKNKTLIEVLIELQNSDPSFFVDDIIKGLVQDLLLAGTETSASAMEWALSLLLNNPEVLRKAQIEIDHHIGTDQRLIEESDLVHLPYLHCIIKETLRIYPAAPILPPRESSSDCVVGGYHVPRGTLLTLNIWAIQNDPNIWNEPRKFKPERFENVIGERIKYEYIPFGSGRRACPGENLAMRIIGLTLGTLIQCFEWKRIGDQEVDMLETVGVSMWKSNPLKAKCKTRLNMIKFL